MDTDIKKKFRRENEIRIWMHKGNEKFIGMAFS